MARTIKLVPQTSRKKSEPALTPEAREKEMINLAMNVAEEQLRNGTASSQVITHFLKLGTEKEKLEREKLERENKLLTTKAEVLESTKHIEELYQKAMNAFTNYRGGLGGDDSDENIF